MNIDTFTTLIEWFKSDVPEDAKRVGFCQCGSEKLINKSSDPKKMRAFLLVGILMDQFIYTYYRNVHFQYMKKYRIPKLQAHGIARYASPSWLVYRSNEHDENDFWVVLNNVVQIILTDTTAFINEVQPDFDEQLFYTLLKREISSEFNGEHQEQLLKSLNQ